MAVVTGCSDGWQQQRQAAKEVEMMVAAVKAAMTGWGQWRLWQWVVAIVMNGHRVATTEVNCTEAAALC